MRPNVESTNAVLSQVPDCVMLVMDSPLLVGFIGVIAGWSAREWCIRVPEIPACRCNCNCVASEQPVNTWGGGNAFVIFVGLIGLAIAFSNTALALRVSVKDSSTGADKSVTLDVKGKSKGVHGASKGLQLTY